MFFWLFFLLLAAISAAEVWLLLLWGPVLGVLWTIVWMLGSFLLGLVLLRVEGLLKLVAIHRQLIAEEIPTKELADLFFILVGAVLLIVPGFLTDFLGLSLLLPPTRWAIRGATLSLLRRLLGPVSAPAGGETPPEEVIEIFPEKEFQ